MLLRPTRIVLVLVLVSMAEAVFANDLAVKDKKEAEGLVRAIYERALRVFEFPRGRDETRKVCDYLSSVFDVALIKGDRSDCNAPTRFPTMDPYEISDLDDENKLPASRIVGSSIQDGTAIIKVLAPILKERPSGRVVYYLQKRDGRWKVSNMLTYQYWPIDTNQEGGCRYVSGYYQFALPPKTEADLEDLPPLCKALELDNMRRSGSGSLQQKAK